jgi:hypothetical protein
MESLLLRRDPGEGEDDFVAFLDACHNRPVHFSIAQSFHILRIAEELKADSIQTRMVDFLVSAASPAHVISFAIRAPHSPSVLRISALRFSEICHIPNFLSLPIKTICAIVQSNDCVRPVPAVFAQFVARAIRRHKWECDSLVWTIDLLNIDFDLLEALEYESKRLPLLARIIELRRIEREYDFLATHATATE